MATAQIDPKKIAIGTVVANDDPNCLGRCKISIKGLTDNIDVNHLPWATFGGSSVYSAGGGGSISIPKVGAQVRVKFKDANINSMEWCSLNQIDKKLVEEIASDYLGTHVLLYDTDSDLCVKFQPNSGLLFYYKGSNIQITPDNNIIIHYGEGTSGTQVMLEEGKVSIQSSKDINISCPQNVVVDAENVTLNGKTSVQMKGDTPGEVAVNGKQLIVALQLLATAIDAKTPQSGGMCLAEINSMKPAILNEAIQYK